MNPLLRWMLWRELLEMRQNRMLWPVLIILPLIGAALPALLALSSAVLLTPQAIQAQPFIGSLFGSARMLAQLAGISLEQAAAAAMMRLSAGYFLLMPLGIASLSAAYAFVGEKQQRTLEPVLATPISTGMLLLGKTLANLLPALAATWLSALIGALGSAAAFGWIHGTWVWPDRFWWISVLLLAPLIGLLTVLVCLRVSARMNDPQAANQLTGLILVPSLLIVLGSVGGILVIDFGWLLSSVLIMALIDALLFWWIKRQFGREELLAQQ